MKLTKKISIFATDTLVNSGKVDNELRDAYIYSFDYILDFISYVASILIIGGLLHNFVNSIIFLLTLIPLRAFAGGLHASTETKCEVLSYLVFFVVIPLSSLIPYKVVYILPVQIITSLIIIIFSPVDNPKKRFDDKTKLILKKKCIIYICISTIFYLFLLFINHSQYCTVVTLCYLIILINQIIGFIKYNRF